MHLLICLSFIIRQSFFLDRKSSNFFFRRNNWQTKEINHFTDSRLL